MPKEISKIEEKQLLPDIKGAEALTFCRVTDVFLPVREDYRQ